MRTIKDEYLGIKIEKTLVGRNDSDEWQHFMWSIKINGVPFEYKTGLGHFTMRSKEYGGFNKRPENSMMVQELEGFLHIPKTIEILDCLVSDSTAANETFKEFCDTFGYDSDSINAQKTYFACQENGDKLKKALGHDKFKELTQKFDQLRDSGDL